MAKPTNDNPPDNPAQLSLGEIVASLPAVRRAKKANTMSRVHRRLIDCSRCHSRTSSPGSR